MIVACVALCASFAGQTPELDTPDVAVDAAPPKGAHVAAQAGTSVELDTNAKRLPADQIGDADGPDGLWRAEGTVDAELQHGALFFRSDTALGGKVFFAQATERMLVGQSRATVSATGLPGSSVLTLSLLGKGRGQASGARTYGLVDGTALIDAPLAPWVSVRGGVDGQAFHAFDVPQLSAVGASAIAGVRASAGPESAELSLDLGGRGYPFAPSSPNPSQPETPNGATLLHPPTERRADVVSVARVEATSARKLFLQASYTWTRNGSNGSGESFTRHRFAALVGFRLPAQVTCTAQGALQLTTYDDGQSLGQIYFLGDDEESQNLLEVTITRPLAFGVSVVGRLSFMANELAAFGARFSRETAALGVRADF